MPQPIPVNPMMGNPIPSGPISTPDDKNVFRVRGKDGKVYPIRANSPEDAFDILDEIENQPNPSNWERLKSRVANPFEGLTQVPGALYDLAKAESEHPGAGQAALWKGAGSVAVDSVNPVPEFKRLYGEGKSIPASIVGSIPMGVGQTVTDLTEGKVPETIGDLTNFAPALLGVKGIREAKVLNTPVGEVVVNAAKKAGSGTVRAVTSPTALGAGGLVAGLATGNPALGALTGLELAKWRLGQLAKKSGAAPVVPEGGIAEIASVLKQMIKSERGVSGAKAEAIIAKMPAEELVSKVEEVTPKLDRTAIKAQNMERIYKDRLSRGMDYAVPDDFKAKIGWKPQEPGTVESKLAPEPVPEAPKPPQETISAPETAQEPVPAPESPKTPPVTSYRPSVSETARDVNKAIPSVNRATLARMKHVVKQAQKEGAIIGDNTATVREPIRRVRSGETVDGLSVGEKVKNVDSIAAELPEFDEMKGIREIPLSEFGDASKVTKNLGYANARDTARVRQLAEEIKASGRIDPLIVVYDAEGPYILEGGHRFEALKLMGKKSFPAKVVVDSSVLSLDDLEAGFSKRNSYAAEEAARLERQKQHIADSYAKKAEKEAANQTQSESMGPDLEQTNQLMKRYPKMKGESSSEWMQRVTQELNKPMEDPVKIAERMADRIRAMHAQGLSAAQIKNALRDAHGVPRKQGAQMVNMVLAEIKKGSK